NLLADSVRFALLNTANNYFNACNFSTERIGDVFHNPLLDMLCSVCSLDAGVGGKIQNDGQSLCLRLDLRLHTSYAFDTLSSALGVGFNNTFRNIDLTDLVFGN